MKRIKNIFSEICNYENILQAYYMARKCKRYRNEILEFSSRLEENIITIQNELIWQTYTVGRYKEFYIHDPKKRLIMALPFKDRVVQWAIYRQLNPLLDKRYISDSYACRSGYGTHRAVAKVQQTLKRFSAISKKYYVLKMDISKYFYRVDHKILFSVLNRIIADKELLAILKNLIFDDTEFGIDTKDHQFADRRLKNIGMPIGNLTSQMFANLYLNELDQYAKHELRIKNYVRYMDDICIVHQDKKYLWRIKSEIEKFLNDTLKLELNNKTIIRTTNQGVDFCGYRIWATHIRLRKKSALKMKRKMKNIQKQYKRGKIGLKAATASIQSYLGIIKHCDSYQLKRKIFGDWEVGIEGWFYLQKNNKKEW